MYRELVEHSIKNRGKLVLNRDIRTEPAAYERYCSMFYFDKTAEQYVELNKSIRGFDGQIGCEALWLDIDNEDLNIALSDARELVKYMNRDFSLNPEFLRIYFSGNKGFHIAIPRQVLGFDDYSTDLHLRFKSFAEQLKIVASSVDTVVYEKIRIFRIVNSLNAKSKLYKIPLLYSDLMNKSIEEIKIIAVHPQTANYRIPLSQMKKNEGLAKLLTGGTVSHHNLSEQDYDGFFKPAPKGERNVKLFKQACMLFDKSELNQSAVIDIMSAINNNCQEPLSQDEVKNIVISARRKTEVNAKKETLVVKSFDQWLPEWEESLNDDDFKMKIGFSAFDDDLEGNLRGKVCALIGYGGTKKSLLALNAMIENVYSDRVGLYSTMEMPANELINRIVDLYVEVDGDHASRYLKSCHRVTPGSALRYLRENVSPYVGSKIQITENSSLTFKEYDELITRVNNSVGDVNLLVIDGLSMMGGSGKETEIMNENSRMVKELAKKHKIFVILVCHVSRGATKHTRDLNSLIRGSEKILDNVDFTITTSLIIDQDISTKESIEYRNDIGYLRMYNKRGSGRTINLVYSFNPRRLSMTETMIDPSSIEVAVNKLTKEETESVF